MEKCMFLENNDQKNFNRFILFDDQKAQFILNYSSLLQNYKGKHFVKSTHKHFLLLLIAKEYVVYIK